MFFTWLTAKQGRDHERLLAAETREQQRLEKTYVDLLDGYYIELGEEVAALVD
jgi:hypothetical protein